MSESCLRPYARLRLRLGLALSFCLGLSQCAHSEKKPVAGKAAPQVEWYIASKDPLTYCPKGRVLPADDKFWEIPAFVYLADRHARIYIPPQSSAHLRQAIQLREESMSAPQRFFASSESTAEWVGTRLLQVSLSTVELVWGVTAALAGNPNAGDPKLLEKIWSQ